MGSLRSQVKFQCKFKVKNTSDAFNFELATRNLNLSLITDHCLHDCFLNVQAILGFVYHD